MGCSKSSSKREVYSNATLPQETRNISNKQEAKIEKMQEMFNKDLEELKKKHLEELKNKQR